MPDETSRDDALPPRREDDVGAVAGDDLGAADRSSTEGLPVDDEVVIRADQGRALPGDRPVVDEPAGRFGNQDDDVGAVAGRRSDLDDDPFDRQAAPVADERVRDDADDRSHRDHRDHKPIGAPDSASGDPGDRSVPEDEREGRFGGGQADDVQQVEDQRVGSFATGQEQLDPADVAASGAEADDEQADLPETERNRRFSEGQEYEGETVEKEREGDFATGQKQIEDDQDEPVDL